MTRIIDEILSFARMQPAKIARLDLAGVLRKAIALSDYTSKKHETTIHLELHQSAIDIEGDADKLVQMLVNLVVNGIQAMPRGGTLRVLTGETDRAPDDDPAGASQHYVWIDVIDQGGGIPVSLLAKVFEPFFSTKSSEGGTGLGLSVAQGIAREHDGWIVATSEVGRNATFQIHLPQGGPSGHAS
jgi:signal transduction histidine kinase